MHSEAEVALRRHHAGDTAVLELGIEVAGTGDESVELTWVAPAHAQNGAGVVHGGYVFLLADTAFAYCCLFIGRPSVTRTADIAYLRPAVVADRLHAVATVRRLSGRTTICDVVVTDDAGVVLAEFRGHGALLPA